MNKLKQQVGTYLFWQNVVGIVLSMIIILVLFFQKDKWEPWHFIYTMVPTIGCTLIHLGARLTLRSVFQVELPKSYGKKKWLFLSLVGVLLMMEFMLYWMNDVHTLL